MPQQDTSDLKERIITFLRIRGPSLPVHIAKEIDMSILFTSAFLSELIAERRIKISNMKVGSSSLNFLEGQEHRLEAFAQYLKSREKDAFEMLKQSRILKDSEQEPAIRVALRAIKDFAIPFKKDNEIYWRYFTVPESELIIKAKEEEKPEPIQEIKTVPPVEDKLGIFSKEEAKEPETSKPKEQKPALKKKPKKRQASQKKNEQFFDKVKNFLSQKKIKILSIEGVNKNELILKVNSNEKVLVLVAYDKRKLNDSDIIKAGQKALELNLKCMILSLGEPLKKLNSLIEAAQHIHKIEKIE